MIGWAPPAVAQAPPPCAPEATSEVTLTTRERGLDAKPVATHPLSVSAEPVLAARRSRTVDTGGPRYGAWVAVQPALTSPDLSPIEVSVAVVSKPRRPPPVRAAARARTPRRPVPDRHGPGGDTYRCTVTRSKTKLG